MTDAFLRVFTHALRQDAPTYRVSTHGYNFYTEGGYGTRATLTIDRDGIIRHVEQGKEAIDPTGAYQSCSALPG